MATSDEQRFIDLYEANWRPLLGYAVRRVGSAGDAADVIAETFLVAWRRMDSVPAGHEARPWLYGVARRVLSNQRRGNFRRNRLADVLEQHLVLGEESLGRGQRWEDAVATRSVVNTAMSRLNDEDAELLRLVSWEGLTPSEIAVSLDIPAATARTRLHRARKRLRAELRTIGWPDERTTPSGHVVANEQTLVVAPVRKS